MTKNSDESYTPFNEEPGFFWKNYTAIKKRSIVVYERIRNKLGRDMPGVGNGHWWWSDGNENVPPSPKPPKERSPKIRKILNCIPCAVVGILAGAVISQAAPGTQKPISNALHAIWVEQTTYDLMETNQKRNLEIQRSLMQAQEKEKKAADASKKANEDLNKAKKELSETQGKIALLNAKVKQMEEVNKTMLAKWKKTPDLKRVAEAKQKIISARLKELFRLQGKKPALKNEWIPSHITNYAAYIPKQDRSIRVIDRKIKEQRSIKSEAKLAAKTSSAPRKVKPVWASWALERKTSTESSVAGILATPHAAPVQATPPGAVSSWTLANAYGNSASLSPLAPRMQLFVPLDGIYSIPLTKTQWAYLPWAVPFESWATSSDAPRDISPAIATETVKTQNPPVAKSAPPVWAIVQRQPVDKKIATPPSTSLVILKESGLSAENITPEKLQLFIEQTNKTISSLPGNHPLKGTSLAMKSVKVKGAPSLRIFLKHGKRSAYFTIRPGQKSRNYEYLSSESKLMEWAEKKKKKWETV